MSEGSGQDDVREGRGAETAVGGDQWKIAFDGQLDVQGIDQPQLMTSRPGANEKVPDIVALDRSCDEGTQFGFDTLGLEVASPMQSFQRRQNIGVEVRGPCSARPASRRRTALPNSLSSNRSTIADASTTTSAMACGDLVPRGVKSVEGAVVRHSFSRGSGGYRRKPGVGRARGES